jgi:MFS family permease
VPFWLPVRRVFVPSRNRQFFDRMKQATAGSADPIHRRAVLAIAAATGSASLLVNVWYPFLPLFLLQVGAKDEPAALFWVAVGMTAQGVARLLGGPLWGVLSDRVGERCIRRRSRHSS